MAFFVLPKWAKFTQLPKHWKLYQEFLARTQRFTRQSLENPAQHAVVARAPWHVQLWFIDADCPFYDQIPTTVHDQPNLQFLNKYLGTCTSCRHGRVHRYATTISPASYGPTD
jgi:hypothetical protein